MPWIEEEKAYERFVRCVAILNAWLQEPDGVPDDTDPLWLDVIMSYIREGVDESELVIGLVELSGHLLVRLERHGEDSQNLLAEYAQRLRPDGG